MANFSIIMAQEKDQILRCKNRFTPFWAKGQLAYELKMGMV